MLVNLTICTAQKYSFSHYDIEDGLIQSQVNYLSLDNQHRLWIGTLGGACRFDGKEFTPYTRQNGLPTSFVNTVFTDKAGHTWFGTQSGLAELAGKRIINYPSPVNLKTKNVTAIAQDYAGTLWFIISNRLFKLYKGKLQQQYIQRDTSKTPVHGLATDKKGRLYASVDRKGLYYLEKGMWINMVSYPAGNKGLVIRGIVFDKQDQEKIYLQSADEIYIVSNGNIQPFESKLLAGVKKPFASMAEDADGNLWLGADNGAYYLKNGHLIHFAAHNGLTDNPISCIFNDADNNLWLGSQGNGVFKYEGDRIITFDRTQGLPDNQLVMGIAKNKDNHIILGINGGGLISYDGKSLSDLTEALQKNVNDVQTIYSDEKGVIWIGTARKGLWKYDNKSITRIKGSEQYAINGISSDGDNNVWISTSAGCFYIEKKSLRRLDNYATYASAILGIGRDSVIIGTQDGIQLAVNKILVRSFRLDELRTSSVYCMLKYKELIIIGTDDRGLFTWDRKNGQVKNYSLKDGLNSNTVYSLVADDHGVIWAGTGRGVNSITYSGKKPGIITDNSGPKDLIMESNENAAFYDDHKVWIGTTKGVLVYNTGTNTTRTAPPNIIIKSVRLLPQKADDDIPPDSVLTNGVQIPYRQNHLAITFLGIYLKNPEGVSYRYRLVGLDTAYSQPVKTNVVDYPSLPPGNYTFEVKAFGSNGMASRSIASFSFGIIPPFYQTGTFRVLAVLFFILLGIGIQSYRHHIRLKRQRIIEATKQQESIRIRQQTAEDFHDELGNKLTRITVLSEILDTKMSPDKPDQKKLLEQIRQNASSLYNGTKDILWALDPKSDNLYEILCHIKDFGNELFLDTPVEFEFNGIDEQLGEIRLPMEYSRNLPLIFKELLNNILKHAGATHATINLNQAKNELNLLLTDNGKGFDKDIKRGGQGINNIITRTKRIGGDISFSSEKGLGTVVKLRIKVNQLV